MKKAALLSVLLISMLGATSHAFCIKQYMKSVGINDTKTNFVPDSQKVQRHHQQNTDAKAVSARN